MEDNAVRLDALMCAIIISYQGAQESVISEFSTNFDRSFDLLDQIVAKWQQEYEQITGRRLNIPPVER